MACADCPPQQAFLSAHRHVLRCRPPKWPPFLRLPRPPRLSLTATLLRTPVHTDHLRSLPTHPCLRHLSVTEKLESSILLCPLSTYAYAFETVRSVRLQNANSQRAESPHVM